MWTVRIGIRNLEEGQAIFLEWNWLFEGFQDGYCGGLYWKISTEERDVFSGGLGLYDVCSGPDGQSCGAFFGGEVGQRPHDFCSKGV
mmetsp:Transcript_9976/g.42116  ORF Transcript_9976/g.42116 Transcript_9976/m.42116 type:complete len:87 (+) Transcript_9976:221-481(+)